MLGGWRGTTLSHGGWVLVCAALITFPARDQQESVQVAIGKHPLRSDLSLFIETHGDRQLHTRTHRDQTIQICYRALLPHKRVLVGTRTVRRFPNDLLSGIDDVGYAALVARDDAEVADRTVPPEKRMVGLITLGVGPACNLPSFVEPVCVSEISPPGYPDP